MQEAYRLTGRCIGEGNSVPPNRFSHPPRDGRPAIPAATNAAGTVQVVKQTVGVRLVWESLRDRLGTMSAQPAGGTTKKWEFDQRRRGYDHESRAHRVGGRNQ